MIEEELTVIRKFEPKWQNIMQEAKDLRDLLGVSRVCIHTKEFITSAIKGKISPADEVKALEFGAGVAAGLAFSVKIMPRPPSLEASIAGTRAVKELCESWGAIRAGRGAYVVSADGALCLAPSFVVSQPRITAGLGDAMTAAAFFRLLKAIKKGVDRDGISA